MGLLAESLLANEAVEFSEKNAVPVSLTDGDDAGLCKASHLSDLFDGVCLAESGVKDMGEAQLLGLLLDGFDSQWHGMPPFEGLGFDKQ